jgi:hypothetical protein
MQPQPPARRRSPRDDKELDYERQAVSGSSHGFRQHWPQRKAAVHRGHRRGKTTALAQARGLADPGVADSVEVRLAGSRRWRETNWNQSNLGEHVACTLARRFLDMIDTFAQGDYRPETQRAQTVHALSVLVRRRAAPHRPAEGRLTQVVYTLDDLFRVPVLSRQPADTPRHRRRRDWFAAFLDDRPDWEPRLKRWLTDLHG